MADEKKKPWQFSLGRAMWAMTLICITLAVAGALFVDNLFYSLLVLPTGLSSAAGVVVGGMKGALVGAFAGCAGFIVFLLFHFLIFGNISAV